MSFILDALRKSEHERQRSAVPSLTNVPIASPRREVPTWAMVVMGALGISALALAGAWWRSAHVPATVENRPIVEQPLALPQAPPVATTEQRAEPARPPVVVTPAAPPPPAPMARSLAAEVEVAAPETTADAARSATPGATAETTLPSPAAIAALGIAVPPLRLELHAYSSQPSDRFVFINGRKYVEGQQLTEGPELVAIEPAGAVLSQQGQRFLLAPE